MSDSNQRPGDYKSPALPAELIRLIFFYKELMSSHIPFVIHAGFEPTHTVLGTAVLPLN